MQGRAIGPVEKTCKIRSKNAISPIAIFSANMRRELVSRFRMDFSYWIWPLSWHLNFILGWSKLPILPGLEPGIPWFVVRCLIHWATGPKKFEKNEKVSLTKYANLREIIIKLLICATGVRCVVARCRKKQKKGQKSQYLHLRSFSPICAGKLYWLFKCLF